MATCNNTVSLISLLILSLVTTSLIVPSHAHGDSPQDFLDAQNKVRAEVGVCPLEWSPVLAECATNYTMKLASCGCEMVHSDGPYGENLAWCDSDLNATQAVEMWDGEKVDYDYENNCCAPEKMCGHYTQLVWRDSLEVGCAKVRCPGGGTLITCNYDPPGNYEGERPY
ncbi:Pathogenesis-related protein 1 [Linum perenne]